MDPIRAPRGAALTCKGWPQEAALRMLMNNLDPEVAERPEDLVVYGGSGRAARSWAAFDGIVASLTRLEHDETLLVQSGNPVGVVPTHPGAPRVLGAHAPRARRDAARPIGKAGRRVPYAPGRAAGAHRQRAARARLGDMGDVP